MKSSTLNKLSFICLCVVVVLLFVSVNANSSSTKTTTTNERLFEFSYYAEIPAVSPGEGPVHVFIPLASSDEHQEVISKEIVSEVAGEIKTESTYGNSFWHLNLEDTQGKPIPIKINYKIRRKVFRRELLSDTEKIQLTKDELTEFKLFLGPNNRVPIRGNIIERVQKDLPKTSSNAPLLRARAIYDYVIDNMDYKKVGSGWGNGDTYWACSKKYGNCTDFHALFISLARAEKIPSKFEIGFPIPTDRKEGIIGGYHCWVTFHLPKVGWTPIDASEAKKHPEHRDLYFGTHPADRIKFSVGRDIKLGQGHTTSPINFFLYPHVEVSGVKLDKVPTKFSFRELS